MTLSAIRSYVTPRNDQRGQTLVIFALAFILLMGIVGLATDSAFAYFRSISMERAAAAAALAGVPYMPKNFATGAPGRQDAWDRALDEATRNGFANGVGGVTVVPAKTPNDNELAVTITGPSPTFFMNALGFRTFNVRRTAVAGYKPPIALGQPGNQVGSTVAQLGAGSNFYFARYKGWNLQRSEGDAFTPNPDENATGGTGGGRSSDVHQFSTSNGIESPEIDCNSGAFKMPCRGGYNWRIVVPAGQSAEIDVYNAANAPDWGTNRNTCDNQTPLNTACNPNGYYYHEDDLSSSNHCNPTCNAGQQAQYNATGYTLFDVSNTFLRSQDVVLSQTIVYPVDATNWDGDQGNTGQLSTATPSYVNVNGGNIVTQYYSGSSPCNMKTYRAWADIANYDGSAAGGCPSGDNVGPNLLVKRTQGACGTPCSYNSPPTPSTLGPGVYRLRVDALNNDGTFNPSPTNPIGGRSSKGYAVRVVQPGTDTACAGCTISGWEDMCVYTPLNAGTGQVPLFELTKDYAGATIDVDIFDVGDSTGNVDLAILQPNTPPAVPTVFSQGSGQLPILNDGIHRLGPFVQHRPPQNPAVIQGGGQVTNQGPSFQSYEAGYRAASSSYGPWYQGTWIRISIPVPASYNPPAYPNDFWMLQYTNTGGANDTFTYTVSARGGPVRLLTS
ncbi:MAG: pilus assembly protein TadG-related protein [Candidatus Dormibacteria bacterium]